MRFRWVKHAFYMKICKFQKFWLKQSFSCKYNPTDPKMCLDDWFVAFFCVFLLFFWSKMSCNHNEKKHQITWKIQKNTKNSSDPRHPCDTKIRLGHMMNLYMGYLKIKWNLIKKIPTDHMINFYMGLPKIK